MIFPKQTTHFIEQNITFSTWHQQVAQLTGQLLQSPQQTWLLYDNDSYQFSVSFFALIAAGKHLVLPQNGQPQQLNACMAHADIYIGSEALPNHQCFVPQAEVLPVEGLSLSAQTSIVFYTSGSSGQPKAINKTFGQLIIEIEQLETVFGDELAGLSIVSTVSHQHIYGLLFKMLWPIWAGRDVYLSPFEYPEHLSHQLALQPQRRVCLISSPAYYHRLIRDNVLSEHADNIGAMFSSGGPLDLKAALTLKIQLNQRVYEIFGSTETGGIGWRAREKETDEVWQAFGDIAIDVDSESSALSIKSPYMSESGWYQTDDRVQLVNNNQFKLLGRADRIVKIEEKRCSLDEIEGQLKQHPHIDEVRVLLVSDPQGDKRDCLGAVIVFSSLGAQAALDERKFITDRQFKHYLKAYFEPLVIPRKFRYLEQLPYNAQGKLNKQQLEQMFE